MHNRHELIVALLNMRKSKDYRMGIIQAAVMLNAITQREFEQLKFQINYRPEKFNKKAEVNQ